MTAETAGADQMLSLEQLLVVFVDIAAWSLGDARQQMHQVERLLERFVDGLKVRALGGTIQWKVGTGDGFAVGFSDSAVLAVFELASSFFEAVAAEESFKIRMSAASGYVERYHNRLTDQADIVGPAVIKARRLLDGGSAGSFLVEKGLADGVIGLRNEWRQRLVPSLPVVDKHSIEHSVAQYVSVNRYITLSETAAFTQLPADRPSRGVVAAIQQLGLQPDSTLRATEAACGVNLVGVDNFLLSWADFSFHGLRPDLEVVDRRPPRWPEVRSDEMTEKLFHAVRPIADRKYASLDPDDLAPKARIVEISYPLVNRPQLRLSLAYMPYQLARAMADAFDEPISFEDNDWTLREAFEAGALDLYDHYPTMLVAHVAVLTSDNFLLMSQRAGARTVDFAPLRFSPSFEKHMNPLLDTAPFEAVLRGLAEEWHCSDDHGIPVGPNNVKLIAIGREWGVYWNTGFIYVVDLPASAEDVLQRCREGRGMAEARAVGVVPVGTAADRAVLLKTIVSGEVAPHELSAQARATWIGPVEDGRWHDTTGRLRVLAALAHRFGLEMVLNEASAAAQGGRPNQVR